MKNIKLFLEEEIIKLKRRKNQIKKGDPFTDVQRTSDNSLEEDVDEQIGHFDAEVKTSFINRQIIGIRKALARIKIGKYGICERCGRMIDNQRLAVQPQTTLCINCEKELES